jgi:hypothetical protein
MVKADFAFSNMAQILYSEIIIKIKKLALKIYQSNMNLKQESVAVRWGEVRWKWTDKNLNYYSITLKKKMSKT